MESYPALRAELSRLKAEKEGLQKQVDELRLAKQVYTVCPTYDPIADIRELMQAYDQETPDKPIMPDEATRRLRARLVLSEALEFVKSLGLAVFIPAIDGYLALDEGHNWTFEEVGEPDMVEAADALQDLRVVSYGSDVALGLSDVCYKLWDEVQRSNMSKVGPEGKVIKDEQGKVQKPASYSPPDLGPIIGVEYA